jgi:hypothetical protein
MPLTADDRLILVRIKIERAKKHLSDLAIELLAAGYVTVGAVEGDLDAFKNRFSTREELITLPRIPIEVFAISGDIVHNLRSALDHLAYQLVWANTGNEPTSRLIEFPIAKDFATYKSEKTRKVNGMRPEAIEAIDRLKPYKGGNDFLWRIHELDNIDKHRTLFTVARDYTFFADWFPGDYWFKADTPHFAGVFPEQVEQDMQLEIDKAISESKVTDSNALLPSLHQLVDAIENLVLSFKPLLE